MKSTLARAYLLLSLAAVSVSSQTAGDLKLKYGAPEESYEIRPGIFVTVKFAADGRPCEELIERRHVAASGAVDLDATFLTREDVKAILSELAPEEMRGRKSDFPAHILATDNGRIRTSEYENVSVTYYESAPPPNDSFGKTTAVQIKWKNRPCKES
jgi:hypothetical protein